MSDFETTNKIVQGVISRALDKEISNGSFLLNPDADRIVRVLILNKLSILQETFRIEDFVEPVTKHNKFDPTILEVRFSYVPSRDFDWNKPIEWVRLKYQITTLGLNPVEELDKINN